MNGLKKRVLITLVVSLFFVFLVLPIKYQLGVANSKKTEIELGADKKVPLKIKSIKKKPVIVKPVVKKPAEKKGKEVNILITYYSNNVEDCGKTDAISASGKNLNRSGYMTYVAAPKNISFGTKIDVDKIGICQVEDRGGKIQYVWIRGIEYLKLDVFVKDATRQQLLDKGVLKTKGRIIEK
jgi:3D (Asp-Asp-Asp) domain-containing protein